MLAEWNIINNRFRTTNPNRIVNGDLITDYETGMVEDEQQRRGRLHTASSGDIIVIHKIDSHISNQKKMNLLGYTYRIYNSGYNAEMIN